MSEAAKERLIDQLWEVVDDWCSRGWGLASFILEFKKCWREAKKQHYDAAIKELDKLKFG